MKCLCLILFILSAGLCGAQSHQLKIATYNIRYDNADDVAKGNGWSKRCPAIVQLVRFEDFDLFGTQECLIHQLYALKDSLQDYTYIGIGRDDGIDKGEHSAIFYKAEMFQLLENGNFWLSPTTDKPDKGWDAALPRICSWGLFKVKRTGFKFYCFNLHMDHQGVIARRESAKLVMNIIHQKAGKIPVVLMGDFNAYQHDECYNTIVSDGLLSDSYERASIKWAHSATFNGFDPQRCSDSRIDHIFLSKGFKADRYGILNNTYTDCQEWVKDNNSSAVIQRFPSDHYPVVATIDY